MGNQISYSTKTHDFDLGTKGTIRGLQFDDKSVRYAGVPYALPPTGEHRWRKPRPLPSSYRYSSPDGSPFDATKFRHACPQAAFRAGGEQSEDLKFSEDCLILNIWTPVARSQDGKPWPVLLWIHGGWFQLGDASQEPGMDPTEMIATAGMNAIVISIAYRLNVFGFLTSGELLEESNGESAGNFGLWDQRTALEWVKANIGLFGGDPSNITLGGRSAGSYSVEAQVLYEFRGAQPSDGNALFKRFYMISNAIPAQPKTVAETQPQFDELCEYFDVPQDLSGADKLAKLREISWMDLVGSMKKLKNHTFRPVTDDLFFHSDLAKYIQDGQFAADFKKYSQRLLVGEVLNEETLYAEYNAPREANEDALRAQIGNYYAPATTSRILEQYTLPEMTELREWKDLFGRIIADGQVRAPSRGLVSSLHNHGVPVEDIWRYRVAKRLSFVTRKACPRSYGVAHGTDKPWWK